MHMADALLSPEVGGTMWIAAAAALGYSCHRVRREGEIGPGSAAAPRQAGIGVADRRVPLMGVFGAFVFAAQMINFTVPGTGSSGHLGGGLLLAILLGPHAGFLTMASVLVVQALFFGDGGLLALGANICNLGILTCLIAEPLVYRPLAGGGRQRRRIMLGAVTAAVVGLQLGSLGVVVETVTSGISELPWRAFLLLMQPIHLAIGVVEGLVTAGIVLFLVRVQPEVLASAGHRPAVPSRRLLLGVAVSVLLVAAVLSWFASTHPDGLEWSVAGVTGSEEVESAEGRTHRAAAQLQEHTTVLPDYDLPGSGHPHSAAEAEDGQWPVVDAGTSVAGVVGGLLTMLLVVGITVVLRKTSALP